MRWSGEEGRETRRTHVCKQYRLRVGVDLRGDNENPQELTVPKES